MASSRKTDTKDPKTVLEEWIELDLNQGAQRGALRPAFGVDDLVQRVADTLLSGKHVVLSGEAGLGKTAIVHELVRRAA
jgi:ATP-dependent Clp protease ATP-binding subunit ClpA